MEKRIREFSRGQMDLWVISPDDVQKQISELIEMGCEIVSANKGHIHAKFLKGSLPTGESKNDLLKKMMADGWVFTRG